MIVTPIDSADLVSRMGYGPQIGTRTVGAGVVHLSDIIKYLMRRLQPQRFGSGPFMMSPRIELGILFESALERALTEKYATARPGEIVSPEGVFMSPDGVNPDLCAGEEYKATFMSSRYGVVDSENRPLDKFVHWFYQMMGYAKWLEVDRFLLRVFFVNGNYNRSGVLKSGAEDPDSGPTLRSYDIRFTDDEINENWAMLMAVAREAGML